jgi:hypothetical protein
VRNEETLGGITLVRDEPRTRPLLAVPVRDLLAEVESIYRLQPDRRLLIAAGEIHRLLSGESRCEVAFRFEGGKWRVRVGKTEAGELPEIPGFSDGQKLLAKWAAAELLKSGKPEVASVSASRLQQLASTLGNAPPEEVLTALEELNQLWKKGKRDPRLIREGARGFSWLAVQTYDSLELADPVMGKAWALVAISKQLFPKGAAEDLTADEALLAESMGYESGARKLVETLPAHDPMRLFMNRETSRLKAAAEESTDRRTKFLYLKLLSRVEAAAQWYSWIKSSSLKDERSLGTLKAALELDDFNNALQQNDEVRSLVVATLLPQDDLEKITPPETKLGKVEMAITKRGHDRGGAILNQEAIEGFYTSAFYSAIHGMARYYFDQLSTTEGAAEFLGSLGPAPAGTAAELVKWGMDRVVLRRDGRNSGPVIEDMKQFRSLRGMPMALARLSLVNVLAEATHARRAPMPLHFQRLDTRPSGLLEAFGASVYNLYDPSRSNLLLGAVVAQAPSLDNSYEANAAFRARDRERLWQIARREGNPPAARGSALRNLFRLDKGLLEEVRGPYERLMCENTEAGLLSPWVDVLATEKELPLALAALRSGVACSGEQSVLWKAWAAGEEARLLREMGKPAEAWKAVEPWASTWQSEVLMEASLTLADLGRMDEAIEMARSRLRRYPNGGPATHLANLLWRAGKPEEAAEVLKVNESQMTSWTWGKASKLFGKAFAKRGPEAVQAFEAIKAKAIAPPARFYPLLSYLADGLGEAGDHEGCFELQSRINIGIASDIEYGRLRAFEELRQTAGEETAMKWLQEKSPAMSNQMAIILLQRRKYDLLLKATAAQESASKSDVIALFRAAALRHLNQVESPKMKELAAYFESRPQDATFIHYGLFLTGARDEKVLGEKATDSQDLCSIGWIRGVRSASEGRFDEARLWLQVALEAGREDLPPAGFSQEILSRWWQSDQTLAALQAEKSF